MGRWRFALALLSLALAPWAFRVVALVEESRGLGVADARGFMADLVVALLLLALLWPLARVARWLAALAIAVLALGYYANYETIAALGSVASPLDLGFLADPTFVRGSALAIRHPGPLLVVVLASLALAWPALRVGGGRPALAALGAGVVGLGALAAWPEDDRFSVWRQVNALEHNVRWLTLARLGTQPGDVGFADPVTATFELLPELRADLDAPPRFEFDGRGKNVLLVVLESVSGNYLPSAARVHERQAMNKMMRLDRLFADNVGYATFFTHQRRTNRGLYALLCGELPRLVAGMPKMTLAIARGWQKCLPEILRGSGYRTVYLQAAPLAFMLKDRFMPSIGFDEVHGHDWFKEYHLRAQWGVDDRSFLTQSMDMIETLQAGDRPWFLTLLTVGTHHPYVVPASYRAPYKLPFRRAFAYLDEAVGEFFEAIEESGIREDTLILITSDESAGDAGQARDPLAGQLSHNWGFLIALLPERRRARVSETFAQSDVALSVLDYLGLADAGHRLSGRSVFRRYGRGPYVFFGNVNQHTIGGVNPDELLVYCSYEGYRCAAYDGRDGRFFSDGLPRVRARPGFGRLVREVATRSRPPQAGTPLAVPLLTDPVFTVKLPDWQMVQGMAQVSFESHEWIEIELEVEARGEGRAELHHHLRLSENQGVLSADAEIEAGQTLRMKYSFASDLPVPHVSIWTQARLKEGWALDLNFKKRRFLLRRAGERPEEGLRFEVFALDPESDRKDALRTAITPPEEYRGYLEQLAEKRIGRLGADRSGEAGL
jgi:arylsulfatase A-like enzyme